jgi:photosynthetic reaction center H subunit
MGAGAITQHIDLAQLTLYAFFIFFAGLIFYLRREDKREGYPLDSDRSGLVVVQGLPPVPNPKMFRLSDGTTRMAPRPESFSRPTNAVPTGTSPGAPLEPIGDPLLAGVGPGSHVDRADEPARTIDGEAAIVPMRIAHDFSIDPHDSDPRGMQVVGADGRVAGTVADVWVDRAEPQVRYLEVETLAAAGGRRVLLPIYFAVVDRGFV